MEQLSSVGAEFGECTLPKKLTTTAEEQKMAEPQIYTLTQGAVSSPAPA
jgi:hypothetical protein